MTPAELFRSWEDDNAKHAIVWCSDWSLYSRGLPIPCEGCGRLISAWPVVLEKSGPYFHLVCKDKCMPIAITSCGPIPFGGRITENVLPAALEEFQG
jgi:hypothetical protein